MATNKLFLFNAFIPQSINTIHYRFTPVPDFDKEYKRWEKESGVVRQVNFQSTEVEERMSSIPNSHFYTSQPKIWDYCAILSLFQSRNVFPFKDIEGGSTLFARTGKTYEWQLLTSKETSDHLDEAVQKLDNLSSRERYIFIRSLMLLFEGEFFTHYSDFRDVWYLQPLELFCRGVYCLDHNINDPKTLKHIKFYEYLEYCVEKFGYAKQYKQHPQTKSFLADVVTVRDWVLHGKVWDCRVFTNRAEERVFYTRIESLLKAFLLSYLGINVFKNRAALIHGLVFGNQVVPIWNKS